MFITTLSSRELNHKLGRAKKAAKSGPRFVTDRGKLATQQRRNIADALAMPGVEDIEFDPPRMTIEVRPADFS